MTVRFFDNKTMCAILADAILNNDVEGAEEALAAAERERVFAQLDHVAANPLTMTLMPQEQIPLGGGSYWKCDEGRLNQGKVYLKDGTMFAYGVARVLADQLKKDMENAN